MQRELRYIVLKNRDVQRALTDCEFAILMKLCRKVEAHRLDSGRGPFCAVVVERDWPEYEPTWAAIEARVDAEIAANRKAAGIDA